MTPWRRGFALLPGAAFVLLALSLSGCNCTSFAHSLEDDFGCASPLDCPDGWACVPDAELGGSFCLSVGCTADEQCDDADVCNGSEVCGPGAVCTPGAPLDCSALDEVCMVGVCNVASGTCEAEPRPDDTICREPNGVCDAAETCSNGLCPADSFANASVECRPAAGSCDVAEFCPGGTPDCPMDLFQPPTITCRLPSDVCDVAEFCSGSGPDCPADNLAPVGQMCRPATDLCDVAEVCNGASPTCPLDLFAGSGVVCRAAADLCDVAESCTGTDVTCPADGFATAGTSCRPAADDCDVAELCTGSGASCPGDGLVVAGTVCRPVSGLCDVAESCTGASVSCPVDGVLGAGTACRPSVDDCDVGEVCDGMDAACPPDLLEPPMTICRPAAGVCDVAESCTGLSPSCPPDLVELPTTLCGVSTDLCDADDFCDGIGTTCIDQLEPATTGCRPAAHDCDAAESCTGTTASCPVDLNEPDGTGCDDGIVCTSSDTCAGGVCGGIEDDLLCTPGDLCRVDCFGGCGTPPTFLDLSCPSPISIGGGFFGTASCTVDLDSVAAQLACLSCQATSSLSILSFADFTGCSLDGWTDTGADALVCPTTFSTPTDAMEGSVGDHAMTLGVDTSGYDQVWFCFDYADDGAGANDSLALNLTGGACASTVFTEVAGPRVGAGDDETFFSYCIDLDAFDPCVVDNASLGLELVFTADDALAVDDVAVVAASDTCFSENLITDQPDWTCAGGVANDWTTESGTPVCTAVGAPNELMAMGGADWQIRRCDDVSAIDTDVFVSFTYGESAGDEGGDPEELQLFYNTGCDLSCNCSAAGWVQVFALASDLGAGDPTLRNWLVNLSALDPAVNNHPSLGIRVAAFSGGGGGGARTVFFDDFVLGGLVLACAPSGLALGPLADLGSGMYSFDAVSSLSQAVQVTCDWDSPSVPVDDTTRVEYRP